MLIFIYTKLYPKENARSIYQLLALIEQYNNILIIHHRIYV